MGKDLKINRSVSSPTTKYGETFFIKKLCMGEQTFLGKRSMISDHPRGKLMVKSFKGRVKLVFPLVDPELSY